MTEETKETPENGSAPTIVDTEAQYIAEKLDAYQDYQKEFRSNHLTSDEY